jgi:hypothetical protein
MPIDSTQQVENYGNIKHVSNFIIGEQLGKLHINLTPNNNFSTLWREE